MRGESKTVSGERVVAPCRPPEQDMPGADRAMRMNGFSPLGPLWWRGAKRRLEAQRRVSAG
ncbi:hypothetical protein GCM10010398_73960 [Streptomyces fimbriatus]